MARRRAPVHCMGVGLRGRRPRGHAPRQGRMQLPSSHRPRRQPPSPPGSSGARRSRQLADIESVARIGWYDLDIDADSWASSPGLDALFGLDPSAPHTVAAWVALVHPDDRAEMARYFAQDVLGRREMFDREYRVVRADTGQERWVHGRGRLEMDAAGRPIRMLGTIADVTETHRALAALEQSERRYAAVFEGSHDAILIAERGTRRILLANAAASRLLGFGREELLGMSVADIVPPESRQAVLSAFDHGTDASRAPLLRRDGSIAYADLRASPVELDGSACVIGFLVDVTALRRAESLHRRLATAVEHASESVIICGPGGEIEYVNPAFERTTGYPAAEVVGRNPRVLQSGRQSAAFYRAMWRTLTKGRTWSGVVVNRRRDGSLYHEDATISPIRDGSGAITGYVGVQRDVTATRAAESALESLFRERAEVAAALARLQPAGSAEATAGEICAELLGVPGVSVAGIFDFPAPMRAVTLGAAGPQALPFTVGTPLPDARAAYLWQRASLGPWAEAWSARPEDGQYGRAVAALGIRAVAYAPIRNGGELLGVVSAGTDDEHFARHLIEHLPAVGEFAATASALLSSQLQHGHRTAAAAVRIRRVIADGAFRPVFQPIVALGRGVGVGFEALARFDDGTPPDRMLADAHSVGLGVELELALVRVAIAQAARLPADRWLSVNVSPAVLLEADGLTAALAGRTCPIVLEITEHVQIADYPAVRAALASLGRDVSLAVDDAGAGFASLHHVVELRPRYLKLDRSLVATVDADLTRQAMVAGLLQFAERSGCEVIAEGVETPGELAMLRELGIALGQGYLLGRPEPAADDEAPGMAGTPAGLPSGGAAVQAAVGIAGRDPDRPGVKRGRVTAQRTSRCARPD